MDRPETVIELKNVKKAYKKKLLFSELNFAVQRGESCAAVGDEGAGKSVLLKMICGLVRPDEGEIIVGGERLQKGRIPRDIGVMLDDAGFLPNETGLKNLAVIAGIRKKATPGKLEDTMRSVGLDPASGRKAGDYFPAMKKRLAMAQALMEDPSLLLLDDPFQGADRSTVKAFRSLLERLNRQEGITILMTSSRLEDVCGLCGSIYRIEDGRLKKLELQEAEWQSLIENVKGVR